MHELEYKGMKLFFNTAAEIDKFKALMSKDDAITVDELRQALADAKEEIENKQKRIDELVDSGEGDEEFEAKIEEIRKEMEAEFLEKAALLAEASAETGDKMDSLSKLTKRELLERLSGVKDDSMSDAELHGYYKGMKSARKQNTRKTDGRTKRTSDVHKRLGIEV